MIFKKKEKDFDLKSFLEDINKHKAFLIFSCKLGENETKEDTLSHGLVISKGFKFEDIDIAIKQLQELASDYKKKLVEEKSNSIKKEDQAVDKNT